MSGPGTEYAGGLETELIRVHVVRRDRKLTYDEVSMPPEDVLPPLRDIDPRTLEGRLRTLGWRLVAVPEFASHFEGVAPSMQWGNPHAWLVISPDETRPVARFRRRPAALRWAQEQAGLGPA
ncbi:hypothetical protein [Rhodovastum atsumiense]|uniref:Uncharacterized protein n=1 Tax=Rhodovastum atsumiense TaxID=504468 RepID=A0A5M6IJ60_9PROT|nr:hypothetical protein [Rhodovastum atsumiense]KAA5608280.1 hypothetical protein F1189_29775 [Rhodovastum atsumiense]